MRPRLMPEPQRVHFTPSQLFERHNAQWQGLQADIVTALQPLPRVRVSNFYIECNPFCRRTACVSATSTSGRNCSSKAQSSGGSPASSRTRH